MKETAVIFCAQLPPLACIVAAGFIACHGKEGWGWFLLAAPLLSSSVKWQRV